MDKKLKGADGLPFYLFFVDGATVNIKEFEDIITLCSFVGKHALDSNEYSIVQGELIKHMQPIQLGDIDHDAELVELDGIPESGIQVLPPERIQELIEQQQQ